MGRNVGSVSYSYATGSTSAEGIVGGLVGDDESAATISYSYATGKVTATSGSEIGGLLGIGSPTSQVTHSYWDEPTTGQNFPTGGTGLTSAQMQQASSFTGFNFTSTPGAPGNNWVLVDADGSLNNAGGVAGAVFPMLASEYSTTINNAHQLQLVVMNTAASYTLAQNIIASATGVGGDVWGSAGFVPIGNATTAFAGTFDGLSIPLST